MFAPVASVPLLTCTYPRSVVAAREEWSFCEYWVREIS